MTKRQPAAAAPGPLEGYGQEFDDRVERRNAREAFRRYLEGLLPAERTKTLTALANAEPSVGAQQPRVQSRQWFLSESTWDAAALHARRVEVLRADPATAPTADGVLVIDETGDRTWGTKTAHLGRQEGGQHRQGRPGRGPGQRAGARCARLLAARRRAVHTHAALCHRDERPRLPDQAADRAGAGAAGGGGGHPVSGGGRRQLLRRERHRPHRT